MGRRLAMPWSTSAGQSVPPYRWTLIRLRSTTGQRRWLKEEQEEATRRRSVSLRNDMISSRSSVARRSSGGTHSTDAAAWPSVTGMGNSCAAAPTATTLSISIVPNAGTQRASGAWPPRHAQVTVPQQLGDHPLAIYSFDSLLRQFIAIRTPAFATVGVWPHGAAPAAAARGSERRRRNTTKGCARLSLQKKRFAWLCAKIHLISTSTWCRQPATRPSTKLASLTLNAVTTGAKKNKNAQPKKNPAEQLRMTTARIPCAWAATRVGQAGCAPLFLGASTFRACASPPNTARLWPR